MTVVELIEALIPYGDNAQIRVAMTVGGQALYYGDFTVASDGAEGVDFVVQLEKVSNWRKLEKGESE